ncbi:MAG: NUDIX hydrolase, partial [Clostridia bacterium]|nr:NUDIX hydrolase [Clostridia bacterium]
MRTLFEVDYKNYRTDGTVGKRPSARAIIIKDEKIAMVYSDKYDYYKFPGGGVEQGEDNVDAM